jgi:hypothetical protein
MPPRRPTAPASTFPQRGAFLHAAVCAGAVSAALLSSAPAGAAPSVLPASGATTETWREWRCVLSYMPARSTWIRHMALRADTRRVLQVRIDGQDAHSFAVQDTLVLTSMDGEHIAFDVATGLWESDFRSAAQGRGRCEAEN